MNHVIEVAGLHVSYNGKPAIKNVSFEMKTGKLIGIIGPNGAGKSTLMKAMLELVPRDSGQMTFKSASLKDVQKQIAYVPQRSGIDWNFPIIVQDTVLLGVYPRLGLFHRPKKRDKQLAMECLQKVGMEKYAKRQIGELSGGQQQRVFLARALAQEANYLFLDEPFVGIDLASEQLIISILKELRDKGKSIFIVHHDLGKVEDYFDELLLLNKELIASGPVKKVLNKETLKHAFQTPPSIFTNMEVGI